MFRGINAINMDDKGRVGIPVRYRDRLKEEAEGQLVVTIDTEETCLLLYPLPEWEIIEHKISALPSFNPAARRIQRLLIGHATELELDGSSRICVPPALREYAGLEKKGKLVLIGQGKKFEMWSETQWEQGRTAWLAAEAQSDNLPEELQNISL